MVTRINDLKKIVTKKTKVILVNPNLPIEFEFDKNLKNKIYKLCLKKNIILVYDEAYYHLVLNLRLKIQLKKKFNCYAKHFQKLGVCQV